MLLCGPHPPEEPGRAQQQAQEPRQRHHHSYGGALEDSPSPPVRAERGGCASGSLWPPEGRHRGESDARTRQRIQHRRRAPPIPPHARCLQQPWRRRALSLLAACGRACQCSSAIRPTACSARRGRPRSGSSSSSAPCCASARSAARALPQQSPPRPSKRRWKRPQRRKAARLHAQEEEACASTTTTTTSSTSTTTRRRLLHP